MLTELTQQEPAQVYGIEKADTLAQVRYNTQRDEALCLSQAI